MKCVSDDIRLSSTKWFGSWTDPLHCGIVQGRHEITAALQFRVIWPILGIEDMKPLWE